MDEITVDIAQTASEGFNFRVRENTARFCMAAVGPDAVPDTFAKRLIVKNGTRNTDDRHPESPAPMQRKQRGKQLPGCQVTGGTKQDHNVRTSLVHRRPLLAKR